MRKKTVLETLRRYFGRFEGDTYGNIRIHDLVPGKEGQMGFFFIADNELYCGEIYGDPFFCRIGNIKNLEKIQYRIDGVGDSESVGLLFLFSGYWIWVVFGRNLTTTVSVFDECQYMWVIEECELGEANLIDKMVESLEP